MLKDRNPHQNDEWMASLAWTNVVDKLPATIRCSQAVIDVKKFSTAKQFDQIDRMYEEYIQATGPTEPVNMVNHQYQNYQENFLRGGTVNAMVDPYAIMPDHVMDTQDIAQVNYQQAYNQARWRNSPGPGYHHPYRSNYQPYYGQNMYQQPMQPPPPAPAPATASENAEKKEEEKKEEKPAEKSKEEETKPKGQNQRNNQRQPRRFNNNRFGQGQNQTQFANLAERAAREGVFKERQDFCKYHRMFGINSNRCENQKTCAFYSFIEGKIPDTPLRPLTQQEQLLDQNKKQMQTFMVDFAGAFMETLKDCKTKAGANTNNALVDFDDYTDFIMELNVDDPEYLHLYLPIEEETFGNIRTEAVVDSNNHNRHGHGSSSEEEEHSEIRQEDSQEEIARQYEAWLRGDEAQETPPIVTTSVEEQEMEQTRRMTRTLLHQLRERVVEIEASNHANLPSTSTGDELDPRLEVVKDKNDPQPQEVNKMMREEHLKDLIAQHEIKDCHVQIPKMEMPKAVVDVKSLSHGEGQVNLTKELEEFILSFL